MTYLPETKKLNYEFVPLSELDTISDETTVLGGLENNARLDLNLFPNPVSDQITIQLNEKNHDIIKIEIFSSVGKKLLEASIAGGNDSFSLNLSSLDNSLYYSYISNKNKAQIEKIIVNNPTF
ncbi:T9SS type A sorting domain-containing protein [Cyclobacteriaceae bacterium]|nr:T9SS type A sorting domain-containing protein [Cyclobacteriaceae bacterium]MDB4742559.1 T9SS type A sorting domain-containing protein [Cyclobacteriaceae bacterium]